MGGIGAQELLLLLLMFLIYVLPVVANYKLAVRKNRNPLSWVIVGMFFSWLSTLLLLAMPKLQTDKEYMCSDCGGDIKEWHKYCPACGGEIDRSKDARGDVGSPIQKESSDGG